MVEHRKPIDKQTTLILEQRNQDTSTVRRSRNERGSSGSVILESWRNLLLRLVVASKTVDSRFNQDKTELGVLVLPVDFKVLANGNRLFDEVPKVLRDGWAKSYPQTKGICGKVGSVKQRTRRKRRIHEFNFWKRNWREYLGI